MDTIPLSECARRSGIHRSILYRDIGKGKLRAEKIDGEWHVAQEDFDAFVTQWRSKVHYVVAGSRPRKVKEAAPEPKPPALPKAAKPPKPAKAAKPAADFIEVSETDFTDEPDPDMSAEIAAAAEEAAADAQRRWPPQEIKQRSHLPRTPAARLPSIPTLAELMQDAMTEVARYASAQEEDSS